MCVSLDITSEAEELCSKPQEEPKTPTFSTSEPEPTSPKRLTPDEVRKSRQVFDFFHPENVL